MKKYILSLICFTIIYTSSFFASPTPLTKKELEERFFNIRQQEIINSLTTIIFNNTTIPVDNTTIKKYFLFKEITKRFSNKNVFYAQEQLKFFFDIKKNGLSICNPFPDNLNPVKIFPIFLPIIYDDLQDHFKYK